MSELPKGWVNADIGDLCLKVTDGSHNPPKASDEGLPMLSAKNIHDGLVDFNERHRLIPVDQFDIEDKRTRIEAGDILLTIVGTLGRSAVVSSTAVKFTLQRSVAVLSAPQLNPYAFRYFLESHGFQKQLEEQAKGTAQKGIYLKALKQLTILVPPLAEQKRIVEKLDQVLAQVDTIKARLDGIPTILKRFRQSVLAAAVSGKLTEEWRDSATYPAKDQLYKKLLSDRKRAWLQEQERSYGRKEKKFNLEVIGKKYKEPMTGFSDELDLTQINSIPKEWLISNLDSVSIAMTGKTPSTSDEKNWNGKVPFISPSQILPEGEVVDPERFVSEFAYSSTPILPVNSVLIVCIGTIGKVGFLKKESAFNQQINALIPSDSINSKFLFIWAKTLHEWLNKTSSAIVNAAIINKSRLCSAPCPVPSLEEQTEIVRLVDQYFAFADTIEKQVQKAQQRVDKLTQSILAKAFRGELVPQDPNDEPAEELLKRIAAARAESEALAKAAKKVGKRK
ncbi:restriction endonuclease subunit S [Marinomonas sp.]|uniref:restriction endonuclease subunit S n=1 Tax=Marinomonas sp. TaxID=1904862 RepID=UPI003A92D34A